MGRRRNSSSVTNLLSDIADDIKDFLDDEVIDRGRDTERDLRRAGRNWVDSDDDDDRTRRSRRGSGRGYRRDDDAVDELYEAVRALAKKVDQLAADKK
jgi:hypothetical protein